MKSILYFTFSFFSMLFCSILASPHSAHAVTFSASDIAGEWSGYFQESTGGSSYWIYGDMTLDRTGKVTGGSWVAVSNKQGTFVGGSLALDKTGVLTGTISTHEDGSPADDIKEMTLVHGKMASGKELVQGVVRKNNGNMDLVSFVRKSTASFALSDLDGDWFGFHHYTNGAGTTDNWSVDLTIQNGTTTSNPWKSVLANTTGTLTGTFAVDNATGEVSWSLLSSHIDGGIIRSRLDSRSAQLTETKSIFTGVDLRDSGFMDFGIYLKEEGAAYQTTDLQGTWAGYFFEIRGGFAYWIYGSITLDSEGHCIEGNWESASATKGTFTGGTVGLDSAGKLSGTLTSSDSRVMTIQSGFMSARKSIIAATILKDNGASDLVYFLKMEAGFSWPMFLPAITANSPPSQAVR